MEETRSSVAAMKDTVRDARKLIAGAEEKLNTLVPAVKAIPPTLAGSEESI